MIGTEGSDNLKIFIDYLNNIHPTIKFTSSHSYTNVPFLHVNVSLNNGNIYTDLYTKPTDKHQHLLFSSCHPLHTKKSHIISLALRLRRICSTYETFKTRATSLLNKYNALLTFPGNLLYKPKTPTNPNVYLSFLLLILQRNIIY